MNAGGLELWIAAVFWTLVITAPWMFMGYGVLRQRIGRANSAKVQKGSGRKTTKRTTQRSKQKEKIQE